MILALARVGQEDLKCKASLDLHFKSRNGQRRRRRKNEGEEKEEEGKEGKKKARPKMACLWSV